MPLLVLFGALLVPRFVIAALWFLSTWFSGVFQTVLWPIIGFIGFPYALLTYSVIVNWFGGMGSIGTLLVLALAVLADLGSWWGSSGHYHWHSDEQM